MWSTVNTKRLYVERGLHKDKTIAVLTSGGGAQGMNAVLLTVVRLGIYLGCKVYLIHDGFKGLIDNNDDKFEEAEWESVSNIVHLSGSIIGSTYCAGFKQRENQLNAAKNLVEKDISHLLVIGGDGTLTGVHLFEREWSSLLDELVNSGRIEMNQSRKHNNLHVVAVAAAIENDFCGTDFTIGSDSTLHRIIEAADLFRGESSIHRTVIMEVKGRKCGYLALLAGICSGADYVLIPESPPRPDWRHTLVMKLGQKHCSGRHSSIIILAEGAVDRIGQLITAEDIKMALVDTLKHDVRITLLNHLQRGGSTSSFDRVLAQRMGAEALLTLLGCPVASRPVVIVLQGNQIKQSFLEDCVQQTQAVHQAMNNHNWEKSVLLRGRWFQMVLEAYNNLSCMDFKHGSGDHAGPYNLAVMHIGAPTSGMNAAVRAFVKSCSTSGNKALSVLNGLDGLISGDIEPIEWDKVQDWIAESGAILGAENTPPDAYYDDITKTIHEFQIHGIFVVGDFEAYEALVKLIAMRPSCPELSIPFILLPTSSANNVPGTELSLGSDSSLNQLTNICDQLKKSSNRNNRKTFIVETIGEYCGYLASMAGLCGVADAIYTKEKGVTFAQLKSGVKHIAAKIAHGDHVGIVLLNENASENYDVDFLARMHLEEGKGLFKCNKVFSGPLQDNVCPSPLDRTLATVLSVQCCTWLIQQCTKRTRSDSLINNVDTSNVCVIGLEGKGYKITPVVDLITEIDFRHRVPQKPWWLKFHPLQRIISQHDSTYNDEDMKRILTLIHGL